MNIGLVEGQNKNPDKEAISTGINAHPIKRKALIIKLWILGGDLPLLLRT